MSCVTELMQPCSEVMINRRNFVLTTAAAALGLMVGCGPGTATKDASGKKTVVTTTTMLQDLATVIGGEDLQVRGIMKPGGDPHLYKPTPADASMIARSDMVLTNGLKLEGWIDDLVRNAGGKASIKVASKGIEALRDPNKTNYPDPHIWHDPTLWTKAAQNVRDAFIELDPEHAEGYRARTAGYIKDLGTLDAEIKKAVETLPAERRVLITSHDAFQYYAKRYGLKVMAVQGLSTESEAGARDVARIVDAVKANGLPAIFVETSVNPKLIEQISRESGAKIGGTLYSDSLGEPGGPGGTYLDMLRQNTQIITKALGGKAAAPAPTQKAKPQEAKQP